MTHLLPCWAWSCEGPWAISLAAPTTTGHPAPAGRFLTKAKALQVRCWSSLRTTKSGAIRGSLPCGDGRGGVHTPGAQGQNWLKLRVNGMQDKGQDHWHHVLKAVAVCACGALNKSHPLSQNTPSGFHASFSSSIFKLRKPRLSVAEGKCPWERSLLCLGDRHEPSPYSGWAAHTGLCFGDVRFCGEPKGKQATRGLMHNMERSSVRSDEAEAKSLCQVPWSLHHPAPGWEGN